MHLSARTEVQISPLSRRPHTSQLVTEGTWPWAAPLCSVGSGWWVLLVSICFLVGFLQFGSVWFILQVLFDWFCLFVSFWVVLFGWLCGFCLVGSVFFCLFVCFYLVGSV